jgi:hypothetical protein
MAHNRRGDPQCSVTLSGFRFWESSLTTFGTPIALSLRRPINQHPSHRRKGREITMTRAPVRYVS